MNQFRIAEWISLAVDHFKKCLVLHISHPRHHRARHSAVFKHL